MAGTWFCDDCLTRRKSYIGRRDPELPKGVISTTFLCKLSSQTSSSWALPAALTHSKSTDAAFIGHTFKWAAHSWQIHQKTANKRGPVSWIWYYGSELWEAKGPISRKAHWLCHRCWDRGVKKVLYTSLFCQFVSFRQSIPFFTSIFASQASCAVQN